MSDKSFEQQVREELSDLRMKPNAAVWESVAASLQKERKRRWALWMVVLLTAIAGATFWWQMGETTTDKLTSNTVLPSDEKNDAGTNTHTFKKGSQSHNDTAVDRVVRKAATTIKEIAASIQTKKDSHSDASVQHKEKIQSSTVNNKTDLAVLPQSVSPLVLKEKKEEGLEKKEEKKIVQSGEESLEYKQKEKKVII